MSELDVLFFTLIIAVPIVLLIIILIDVLRRKFNLIELSRYSDKKAK